MSIKCYCVYDSKVEGYMKPFFMRSRGEATRAWIEICNDEQSQMFKHPSDFTLFEIGEFDETKGTLIPSKLIQSLGCAVEFKKSTLTPISEVVPGILQKTKQASLGATPEANGHA